MAANAPKPTKSKAKRYRAELRASMLDNTTPEDFGPVNARERLSFAAIELAYQKDPMVYGGINKKSLDMTKRWHRFESSDINEDDPDPAIVAKLERFARRVGLRSVTTKAVADAVLYGDAYVEKVALGDTATAEQPLVVGRIVELPHIVPSTISVVREKATDAEIEHGSLKHYRQQSGGKQIVIHPSRVEHLRFHSLGDDVRGLGAVEAAIRTIVAKEKGDEAMGDQMAWYAKGFHTLTIDDATTEELDEAWRIIKKAKRQGSNEFVGSDRHHYSVQSGAVYNPDPFNTAFYYNLASALGMPKDVLIGASAGAITGSETNLRDYYEALDALLQTHLTPFLERLYAHELGVAVEELPVRIVWNPLYVNEETEAKTRFTEAQAASIAWRDGAITKNEYRQRLGLDPVPDGDEFNEMTGEFPGFGAPPVDDGATDELRKLAGDTA